MSGESLNFYMQRASPLSGFQVPPKVVGLAMGHYIAALLIVRLHSLYRRILDLCAMLWID
jgi:hypothetical protein